MRPFLAGAWALLALGCSPLTPVSNEATSAKSFVQDFYDWYLPGSSEARGVDTVLRSRPSALSPELRAALREDSLARQKSPDWIVGLDFDPFTDSQDPPPRVSVTKVEKSAGGWRVFVRTVGGAESARGDLVAQVQRSQEGWQITNLVYQQGSDLLAILRRLKKDRESGGL